MAEARRIEEENKAQITRMHMLTQAEARKLSAEQESDATLIRAQAASEAQKIAAEGIEAEAGAQGRAEMQIEGLRVADASIMDSASLSSYFVTYRDMGSKVLRAFLGTNLVNIWGLATVALLVIAVEENYKLNRSRAVMIVLLPSLISFLLAYFMG